MTPEPPTDRGHAGPDRRHDVSDGDAHSADSKDPSGTATSLAAVLHLVQALPASGRRQAAYTILPAVETLRLLQNEPDLQPWDTLIHRRCRLLPRSCPASGPLGPAVCVRRRDRAGWQLFEATVSTRTRQVGHELVRRREVPWDLGTRRSSPTTPPGKARRVTTTGPVHRIVLEEQVVSAWAEASGDHNAVHLVPGAAREAGLAVSDEHTVAHGLLLAAISLSWVPCESREQGLDVSFHTPVPVRTGHPAHLELDTAGNLTWEGLTVLRRR